MNDQEREKALVQAVRAADDLSVQSRGRAMFKDQIEVAIDTYVAALAAREEPRASNGVTEAMVDAGIAAEAAEGCWSSVDLRGVIANIIRAALAAREEPQEATIERVAKSITMYKTGDPQRIDEFRAMAQIAVEAARPQNLQCTASDDAVVLSDTQPAEGAPELNGPGGSPTRRAREEPEWTWAKLYARLDAAILNHKRGQLGEQGDAKADEKLWATHEAVDADLFDRAAREDTERPDAGVAEWELTRENYVWHAKAVAGVCIEKNSGPVRVREVVRDTEQEPEG